MYVLEIPCFDLKTIYLSKQSPRWIRVNDNKYIVLHKNKAVKIISIVMLVMFVLFLLIPKRNIHKEYTTIEYRAPAYIVIVREVHIDGYDDLTVLPFPFSMMNWEHIEKATGKNK